MKRGRRTKSAAAQGVRRKRQRPSGGPVKRGRRTKSAAAQPGRSSAVGANTNGATGGFQPTEPSICSSIRRLHSTAYSIGSIRVTGSMNPFTTMPVACSSESPRLMR